METIEQIVRKPTERRRRTPLFLQHDLFHDVRCWERLTGHFNALGYEVRAISLPAHGQSSSHKGEIDFYNLEDYVNPLARRLARITPRPVVIAHGIGALLLHKILEDREEKGVEVGSLPGAALLAPLPPNGVRELLAGLRRRHPWNTLVGRLKRSPYHWVRTPRLARELFLGPANGLDDAEFHGLVVPESLAIFEQLQGGVTLRERTLPLPLRVFAGDADACYSVESMRAQAQALGAEFELFAGAGHDLMLEPCAEELARRIDRWIVEDLRLP
jgi:alpha-beta hydrolase superfamily lysophospholipase